MWPTRETGFMCLPCKRFASRWTEVIAETFWKLVVILQGLRANIHLDKSIQMKLCSSFTKAACLLPSQLLVALIQLLGSSLLLVEFPGQSNTFYSKPRSYLALHDAELERRRVWLATMVCGSCYALCQGTQRMKVNQVNSFWTNQCWTSEPVKRMHTWSHIRHGRPLHGIAHILKS